MPGARSGRLSPPPMGAALETFGWVGLATQVPFVALVLSKSTPYVHDPIFLLQLLALPIGLAWFLLAVPCAVLFLVRLVSHRRRGGAVPWRQFVLTGLYVFEGFLVAARLPS